ncbi:hypothetical protein QTL95_23665 [Rhizobium sp. S152]|uniref:hypothetical protein n=1 Tax=Rhizobium sp. S152 TaxID=3055038 RepID=UPI0025AA1CB8|nr:hypothetical protein [Rhizobium sp. S152]MDM9628900.1 hypothetical protein [Rhizobium sp. S152]
MLKRLRMLALLAATALAGCANIDAEDIQTFGVATTAVADAAKSTGAMRRTMDGRYYIEQQAYLFSLGDAPYKFPPPRTKPSDVDSQWNQRVAFAQALADYGAALAKAAAGVAGDDLGTALGNLQKTVDGVIPATAKTSNYGPVSDATLLVARKAITEMQYRRIQRIVEKAHPSIVKGRALLAADFAAMADNIAGLHKTWQAQQAVALAKIHGARASHSPADTGARYRAYREFLKDRQEMDAAVEPFLPAAPGKRPPYETLLDNFVAAHKELAENKPDPLTLERFIEAAKELQAAVEPFLSAKG